MSGVRGRQGAGGVGRVAASPWAPRVRPAAAEGDGVGGDAVLRVVAGEYRGRGQGGAGQGARVHSGVASHGAGGVTFRGRR